MNFAQTAQQVYGRRQDALPVMWGKAAWVQSQSTPGASALAAPHQSREMQWAEFRVEEFASGSQDRSRR